jgi:hypothetical protein
VFHIESLQNTAQDDFQKLASAIYLQVSTISQALIFVTRSRSWSFVERPGFLLVFAFLVAQLVSDLDSVHCLLTCIVGSCLLYCFLVFYLSSCSHGFVILFADCYSYCCICKLGICCDQGHWMGLGWCHLALQHRVLLPTRHH